MKKITLFDNEKIAHKVTYSNKSTIMYFLLFVLYTVIFNKINEIKSLSTVSFLIMFLLVVPSFIKLILHIYRRTFQRIYITTHRIIIVNGYLLKYIKMFNINDITQVFYKSKKFDQVNNASLVKCIFKNHKKFIFKKVKYGPHIAKLLSEHLIQKHDMMANQTEN